MNVNSFYLIMSFFFSINLCLQKVSFCCFQAYHQSINLIILCLLLSVDILLFYLYTHKCVRVFFLVKYFGLSILKLNFIDLIINKKCFSQLLLLFFFFFFRFLIIHVCCLSVSVLTCGGQIINNNKNKNKNKRKTLIT